MQKLLKNSKLIDVAGGHVSYLINDKLDKKKIQTITKLDQEFLNDYNNHQDKQEQPTNTYCWFNYR
ncbi:hypothetical protein [Rickettsia rickettsii]|uniref:Poly-beta-hydroxybutyrate polymerase n=2 Tax=Rickettsia rickettsii TaxID=783 RepID=B0BV18_RICRO|nr:hypothetical protein [Rickettsia rickettsii]ABY73078.1 poly-beta-hydroxybutyrate polymerase [Rickettsia rickettsii str. Iowa]AFB21733.1 poly-beta-hydroxybutyrate polymerase [Rickettsia rickettsii str. Brazil]ABV76704.1 hypothetical protein A1G_06255 [Rickettsia rickettsii str. 'Sheila Smith']AFB24048.1 poly-beta-hydroxybutyrate polymerase [Rickettsia rickettsii str. Colombia]AFB25392.1 poly-beta-hydroxybutyrate polymerase [Rickettsia rickettsii str. Arizona]